MGVPHNSGKPDDESSNNQGKSNIPSLEPSFQIISSSFFFLGPAVGQGNWRKTTRPSKQRLARCSLMPVKTGCCKADGSREPNSPGCAGGRQQELNSLTTRTV